MERSMSEQNPQGQQQVQVTLRDEKAVSIYSNVSRVAVGPQAEEVIVDFGVMAQDPQKPEQLVMDISTKVYLSQFAAKKLALTLSQAVQRYEQQFGAIELDPRRRVKQGG
jgi:hypothetical protein